MALIALIASITNYITHLSDRNQILNLAKSSAKHDEQLNGGLEPRIKQTVEPIINQAAMRIEQTVDAKIQNK